MKKADWKKAQSNTVCKQGCSIALLFKYWTLSQIETPELKETCVSRISFHSYENLWEKLIRKSLFVDSFLVKMVEKKNNYEKKIKSWGARRRGVRSSVSSLTFFWRETLFEKRLYWHSILKTNQTSMPTIDVLTL